MRRFHEGLWRGSFAAGVAGLLAITMLAFTAGSGAAISTRPSGSNSGSDRAPTKTVLESEFGSMTSKVSGDFGRRGTVAGTFTPRRFAARDGNLVAIGKLRATMTRGNGEVVGKAVEQIRIPVRNANGDAVRVDNRRPCQILNLVLGPLDLNLLGLEVHLNRVVLDIVGQPGPGNLLGNLLCAIAGLLDRNGVLTEISQILNAILALLRV